MTTPTRKNPTGISDYDVTAFARLPEWHDLTTALNDFINAANRRGLAAGQRQWLEALHHHATALSYGDCCSVCARTKNLGKPVVPAVVKIKDDRLAGEYVCPEGHRWTCSYSVSMIGGLP